MSGIIKAFLLLAVVACIAKAQLNEAGQSCLCQQFRNGIDSKSSPKNIQFYPATIFCDRVEIIVTSENGYRYCLNTELHVVKKMIARFMKVRKNSSSKPISATITSRSTSSNSTSTSTSASTRV